MKTATNNTPTGYKAPRKGNVWICFCEGERIVDPSRISKERQHLIEYREVPRGEAK